MSVNGKRKRRKRIVSTFDPFEGILFFILVILKLLCFSSFPLLLLFFKSLRAKIVQVGFFFFYEMRGENLHVFPEDVLVLSVNRPSLKESTRASRKCN